MTLSMTDHAVDRYRQRIWRDSTFDQVLEAFYRSEIAPDWIINLLVTAQSYTPGSAFMVDGNAVFIVEFHGNRVVVKTVISVDILLERRSFRNWLQRRA